MESGSKATSNKIMIILGSSSCSGRRRLIQSLKKTEPIEKCMTYLIDKINKSSNTSTASLRVHVSNFVKKASRRGQSCSRKTRRSAPRDNKKPARNVNPMPGAGDAFVQRSARKR